MATRPGWAWLAAWIGVATLGIGGVIAWAGPTADRGGDDALRHEIEDLAKIILFRVEEAHTAESAVAARKEPGPGEIEGPEWASVRANLELARLALREYKDGTYPTELSMAEAESKLAREDFQRTKLRKDWSDKEMASGRNTVSQNDHVRDLVAFQMAEIRSKRAEMELDHLKRLTYPKEIARLQGAVDSAERVIQLQKDQAQILAARLVEKARPNVPVALTDLEKSAILRLEEAMQLRDDRQPFEAKAKLAEADRLWRDSEPSRIERRYRQLQDRIRRSADEARRR